MFFYAVIITTSLPIISFQTVLTLSWVKVALVCIFVGLYQQRFLCKTTFETSSWIQNGKCNHMDHFYSTSRKVIGPDSPEEWLLWDFYTRWKVLFALDPQIQKCYVWLIVQKNDLNSMYAQSCSALNQDFPQIHIYILFKADFTVALMLL